MHLEVIRALYTGLTDPTIGINAMIGGLTRDLLSDELPPTVAVYNYADHPWVARKKVNHDEIEAGHVTFPAIAVFLASPPTITAAVQTIYRDGDYPIVIGYFTITPDEVARMRDALYMNRAILRFVKRFDDNSNASMRFRNNVHLYALKDPIVQVTPFVPWQQAVLAAATEFTYHCREHQP